MKILAAQIHVPAIQTTAARDAHLDRIAQLLGDALDRDRVDLVLLPELSTLDYSRASFDHLDRLAEPLDGPSFDVFSALARHHKTFIAYGFARQSDKPAAPPLITHAVVGPDGALVGHYDKLHTAQFGASMENDYFGRGGHLFTFDVAGFRIAPVICYDFRFPELIGRLTVDLGADLILHPVAFARDGAFESWHRFARVRAMENQVYVLSLNRAGQDFGHSIFCPPWVGKETPDVGFGDGEELKTFTLDAEAIKQARAAYPYRRDRLDDYAALPVTGPIKP